MDYFRGIMKAIVPRKPKDIVAVSILASFFSWVGFSVVLSTPPQVTVYTETTYPKEAPRGGFIYLNFDLSFGKACLVNARRVIIGSDGVEYLAIEDSKEVKADERMKYVVRVPVAPAIPMGPAQIRSDFEFGCDWWSRHVWPIKNEGRTRQVNILPAPAAFNGKVGDCTLPEEPGMIAIRAHYRKKGG